MEIKDFINECSKAEDVESFIKDHIKIDYLGYLQKVSLCERVINASCYKEVDGIRKYYMNSPAQYMLLVMSVIYEYTDIEMGSSVVADFDYMDAAGLIDTIILLLPEGEYETIRSILDMMVGDLRENERSIVSYIDNKLDAIGITMDSMVDMLNGYFSADEDGEEIDV